jgi:hypothetical protein
VKRNTFDPETTRIMGEAFDHASRGLSDTGQPGVVQEVIAKRIVTLAESGQRDPAALAKLALQSLGIESER